MSIHSKHGVQVMRKKKGEEIMFEACDKGTT